MLNGNSFSSLPLTALRDIPTPGADAKQIVALVKNQGRVTGYKLSDGAVVNKQDAVALARQGGIQGVGIGIRSGNEYLKSLPDSNQSTNLSHLPSVTN